MSEERESLVGVEGAEAFEQDDGVFDRNLRVGCFIKNPKLLSIELSENSLQHIKNSAIRLAFNKSYGDFKYGRILCILDNTFLFKSAKNLKNNLSFSF